MKCSSEEIKIPFSEKVVFFSVQPNDNYSTVNEYFAFRLLSYMSTSV